MSSSPWQADPDATTLKSLVRITCSPGSDLLEATHAYLTAYCTGRFGSRAADRMSVAIYELVSNAMAYSTLGDMTVEIVEGTISAGVRTTNNTTEARISMLNTHVARLRTDAAQTMIQEMRRSGTGGLRPMLGLARIVHEAGCHLEVEITGQRVVACALSRG